MKVSGLVAALAAIIAFAPIGAAAVYAADPPKAGPPKAPTKEEYERGAKEGPPVIQAAGVLCTPDKIAFRGSGKDNKTKAVITVFEASCKEGLGYVFLNTAGTPKPQAFDCLSAKASPQACGIPENADPKKGLAMRAQAAGRTCDPTQADYLGTSVSTGESFYELACNGGGGFRLGLTGPKAAVNDCVTLIGTPLECKLTPKDAAIISLKPAVQASGKTCAMKDARYIGASTENGDAFYEIACTEGPGFVLALNDKLGFKREIDCSKAMGIGGGCKMTDVTVSQTADAATYTKLAAKAGYPCEVSKYRFIGTDKENREVVELACSNRPDGAVAMLSDGGKSVIYDCVRAGAIGQECKLSDPSILYPKYSQALVAKGKGTCKVSGARFIGASPTAEYIETACTDGLPGWVIAFDPGTDKAQELLNCKQAAASNIPCKLPGNTAH